ncbi:hypothetical protein DRQ17_07200 [bacterium]|nr:MAG: hypothetical protein DRQ17_07200 [bacterium]RKZ24068.1 MAG: hypothetical protein DRQ23_01365 [bacterium]
MELEELMKNAAIERAPEGIVDKWVFILNEQKKIRRKKLLNLMISLALIITFIPILLLGQKFYIIPDNYILWYFHIPEILTKIQITLPWILILSLGFSLCGLNLFHPVLFQIQKAGLYLL